MLVARIADKLMVTKSANAEECQEMKRMGLEDMSLLTYAPYEINMQRQLLLKPDIGREYSALCSFQFPFKDLLFGDDFKKHLKDIRDQKTKLVQKLLQLIKVLARTQGSLATPVTSSQKIGKATVNDLENTKVRGTGTTKPLAQASSTSTVSSCSLLYIGEFQAGNIGKHINAWRSLTSDERILSIVMGCQLEFDKPPCQTKAPGMPNLSLKKHKLLVLKLRDS